MFKRGGSTTGTGIMSHVEPRGNRQFGSPFPNFGVTQMPPQSQIQQLGAAGTSNLAYQQAILDAAAQGAQTAAYEPQQRLGFLGSAIGGMLAGQPQPYMTSTAAPAAGTVGPLSQALSGAATIYGLGSLFGR